MGLNDVFDHVRKQILVMAQLPTMNKAYSMIFVEDQVITVVQLLFLVFGIWLRVDQFL